MCFKQNILIDACVLDSDSGLLQQVNSYSSVRTITTLQFSKYLRKVLCLNTNIFQCINIFSVR